MNQAKNDVDRITDWLHRAGWTYGMTQISRRGQAIWLVDAHHNGRRIKAEDVYLVTALTKLQAFILAMN
jgi:hypothetical protein